MSGRWSKRIFLKERKPVSKLDPRQTLITLPNEIPWQVPDVAPPDSVAEAVLVGAEEQEGTYLVLMKWFPGWMSAPHTYRNGAGQTGLGGPGAAAAAANMSR
jgi:hypothetical protein